MVICEKCKIPMTKVDRFLEFTEPEYELSDGQMSDLIAAQESGDLDEWDYGVIEYQCKTCGSRIQEVNDNVKNYDGLIFMWHKKAEKGDYFSRFIFEYIAFNAYVKSRVILDKVSDRRAIQRIKQHKELKVKYLKSVEKTKALKKIWLNLITELKKNPLLNSSKDIDNPEVDKWWNNSGEELKVTGKTVGMGQIKNIRDWVNMVEFWYAVRNNIFHGGKNPNVQRDHFLVEHAFTTLRPFMNEQLKNLGEDIKTY